MGSPSRHYTDTASYEAKLRRIAERLSLRDVQYDWGRSSGWVAFRIGDVPYRFEHTTEKSQRGRLPLHYGTDCFCRVVLGLESLARLAEDGLYDFRQLIEGFRALPAGAPVKATPPLPDCFRAMGFSEWPADRDAVERRFRLLSKDTHPDGGGTAGAFAALQAARAACLGHFEEGAAAK